MDEKKVQLRLKMFEEVWDFKHRKLENDMRKQEIEFRKELEEERAEKEIEKKNHQRDLIQFNYMKKRQDLKNELDKELNYSKILKSENQMKIKLEELEYEKKKIEISYHFRHEIDFLQKKFNEVSIKTQNKI